MLRPSSDSCCCRIDNKIPEICHNVVDVEAPATLREGYVFWATLHGYSFPVTVPSGGIMKGQTLTVPLLESHLVEKRGKWKDGLFSCFRFGLFHPHLWVAWLCPQILLGQILKRMNMSWLADPSVTKSPVQSLMGKVFLLLLLLSVYDALVAPPLVEVRVDKHGDVVLHQNIQHRGHQMFYILMSLPMTIYGFWVVVKLRAAIRSRYGIPTGKLGRLEDCCFVFCCNCCVMSQLARQTADYEEVHADWCSTTGLKSTILNSGS